MKLTGFGVGTKVAVGVAVRMPQPLPIPSSDPFGGEAAAEQERAKQAMAAVSQRLAARAQAASGALGAVLEAQAMMATDPSVQALVTTAIAEGASAERAVYDSFASFAATLAAMGGYFAERATDLGDVSQRIRAELAGVPVPEVPEREEPFVLVADDLAPADTGKLDPDRVLALVTRDGSPKAHTGIIAAEKGIPAVVAVAGAEEIPEGALLVVDPASGSVIADPTEQELARAQRRQREQAALAAAEITPGALADGYRVQLLANVGKAEDARGAVALGAEGIGLLRTEFLFLDRTEPPSQDEQVRAYVEVMAPFAGKKVVARVLDAGADKPLAFLNDAAEANPALGMRGVRILREHEALLREQLEALAEAGKRADVELWVMAPMIADAADSEYFTEFGRECGLAVLGSMIEVPSAALLAQQVLESSDFASIGTNDLTQYTLAADRVLSTVANFQDPWHPAVLRLVAETARAGAQRGKPVGVCGEAAADPQLAVVLVGLGVTSLSMAPPALALVRGTLAKFTHEQAGEVAQRVLKASSAAQAREVFDTVVAAFEEPAA